MVLRNVVPRQGTEIILLLHGWIFEQSLRNVVPRQGTEIKSRSPFHYELLQIEKCSSPTGDGNYILINSESRRGLY